MSFVTTVVIISDSFEEEEQALIDELNVYVEKRYSDKVLFKKIEGSEFSAGTKYPERNLYWGGFNYLDHDEFIEIFRSLNWENSLLIMGHEDSERGYIIIPSLYKSNYIRKSNCNLEFPIEKLRGVDMDEPSSWSQDRRNLRNEIDRLKEELRIVKNHYK